MLYPFHQCIQNVTPSWSLILSQLSVSSRRQRHKSEPRLTSCQDRRSTNHILHRRRGKVSILCPPLYCTARYRSLIQSSRTFNFSCSPQSLGNQPDPVGHILFSPTKTNETNIIEPNEYKTTNKQTNTKRQTNNKTMPTTTNQEKYHCEFHSWSYEL
jgi:hypothetical protein